MTTSLVPSPQPLISTILLSVSTNLTTLDISYIWYHTVFVFCDWLISLSTVNKVHLVVTCDRISFFQDCIIFYWMYMYIYFIHSTIDRNLGCFYLLAIVNSVALNMGMQISLRSWFQCFGHIPRSGTAGLHGNSIFNFLKDLHTVSSSICTILHFYRQYMKVPVPLYPSCYFLVFGQ